MRDISQRGDVAAGSSVTVNGVGFAVPGPDQPPVTIRWADPDGPQLGTAAESNFSVSVRIPDGARPGTYHIYAVQTVSGKVYARATAVQVAGAEETTTPSNTTSSGEAPAAAADPAVAVPAAEAVTAAEPVPAARLAPTGRTAPKAAPGPNPARTSPVVANPFEETAGQEPAAVAAPLPSRESVSTDLWGGLASGDTRRAGPSLADGARASDRGAPVSAGTAVLLGIGMVLVATAAAVGVGRRQRARAGSPNRPAE